MTRVRLSARALEKLEESCLKKRRRAEHSLGGPIPSQAQPPEESVAVPTSSPIATSRPSPREDSSADLRAQATEVGRGSPEAIVLPINQLVGVLDALAQGHQPSVDLLPGALKDAVGRLSYSLGQEREARSACDRLLNAELQNSQEMALELERRAARVEEAGVIIDGLAGELEKARETIKELEKSHQEVLPALLQAPDRLAIVAYTSAPGERPETEIERLRRLLRESKERTAAEKARNVSMQRWGERALRSRDGKIARAEANLGKLMAHMKELGDRADERVASWHQKLIKAEASAEKRFERLKAASFKCFGEIAKASFDAGHSSCLEGVLRLQPSFSAETLARPEAISHSAVMAATTKAVRVVSEISVLRED